MTAYDQLRSAYAAAIVDWDAADSMAANGPVALARAEAAIETIQFDIARSAIEHADDEARAFAGALLEILDERATSREWLRCLVAERLDEAANAPAKTLRMLEELGRDIEAAKVTERSRLVACGRRSRDLIDRLDAMRASANETTPRPD